MILKAVPSPSPSRQPSLLDRIALKIASLLKQSRPPETAAHNEALAITLASLPVDGIISSHAISTLIADPQILAAKEEVGPALATPRTAQAFLSNTMSLLSIFSSIGHFFETVFGKFGSTVHSVLLKSAGYVNIALPIIEEIAGIEAAVLPGGNLKDELTKWLGTIVTDTTAVQGWVTSAANMTNAQLMQSAAGFVMQATNQLPAGALKTDINFAIELAVQIFNTVNPTPPAPIAVMVQNSTQAPIGQVFAAAPVAVPK